MNNKLCPNCGAPITTEICPYCNAATGLDTGSADMEHPVIECKEANITFWNTWFPLIFAVAFGFGAPSFVFPFLVIKEARTMMVPFILGGIVFGIISIVAWYIALRTVIRYMRVKRNGKEIDATVYGYMNDNVIINGMPAQIVKLLVQTDEGPRFILYQLGDIKKPYKINGIIKLKVYKDIFIIDKKDKYYFE